MKVEDVKREVMEFARDKYASPMSLVIGAGAALVLHGLREECQDIDIEVEDYYFVPFKEEGMEVVEFQCGFTGKTRELLRYKNIDVHRCGEFVINGAETVMIDGFCVHSVRTIYEMKKILNREKDQEDLRMMEKYMDANGINYEPQMKKLSDALDNQCVNFTPNYSAQMMKVWDAEIGIPHLFFVLVICKWGCKDG